ncbi:MAG TPA: VOC family protein [Bryobacteraceae bacterium]|nr:VOC family protein [Bryobacteraceae bacterium]
MPLLHSAPVIAFTATTDADRAKAFYRDVLGLKLVEESDFALVFDAAGTMLRVQRVAEVFGGKYTALGWQVSDIAAKVDELSKAGVRFESYGIPGQDAQGIWTPPGTSTKIAWFKDPDGNILSLTQF